MDANRGVHCHDDEPTTVHNTETSPCHNDKGQLTIPKPHTITVTMSIIYCSSCSREINTQAEGYDADGPLCVNCRPEPEPEHNNLSSHPMCPDCGERAYSLIITTKTDFIAKYNCKCNKTFGHKHTGEKHKHCPYCADNGNKCGYCLNNFS